MATRVAVSTSTTVMKIRAWTMVGIVCPTFSVPGICRSSTAFHARKSAVVVANDPIPRVSKKFVTNPIAVRNGVVAFPEPAVAPRSSRRRAHQTAANAVPNAPIMTRRTTFP